MKCGHVTKYETAKCPIKWRSDHRRAFASRSGFHGVGVVAGFWNIHTNHVRNRQLSSQMAI